MNWQPIETAPKDGTHFLVSDDEGFMGVAMWEDYETLDFVCCYDEGWLKRDAKWWMPLPSPPDSA